jgi:hypothetical protein
VLQVWDSDEERDELIGQCTVNFYDMPKAVRQERWCTITPEGYKSTRAVEAKTENTNAGQVLVALTLDFAHEFDMETDGAEAVGPVQTVVTRKWGQLADVPELEYTGREDLRVRHVRQLLRDKLALLQRGVNFSVRPALHGAIATLINAVKYQQEGELFQARASPPPLPPVLTGHVSSLPPVLSGHVSSLPPVSRRASRWTLRCARRTASCIPNRARRRTSRSRARRVPPACPPFYPLLRASVTGPISTG